jgi:outer membrane protein assembly factor BamB
MSKFSKLLMAASFAALVCGGGMMAPVLAQSTMAWSTEDANINELNADPAARAIYQKYFPELINDPRMKNAGLNTLRELRLSLQPIVSTDRMNKMDAELAKLPPRKIAAAPQPPAVNEWITWGYDPERSGWNRAETTLTKSNVKGLRQVWSTQLSVPTNLDVLSTVTAPVIAANVAMAGGNKDVMVILGANDTLFAIDASTGAQLWQKHYPNPHKPTKPATWLCPNTPNATPTIDKARGLIFFMASDGLLRGISLTDGSEKMKPVEFIAPFGRAWSLNLIDGIVYSTSGRACGEVVDKTSPMYDAARSGLRRVPAGPMLDASAVQAADTRDLNNVRVTRFYTSGARPAAPWGRGGLARGPGNSVYLETSNGRYDPAAGDFSESILRLAPQATRLMDSFTPTNYAHNLAKDLSGSASPVVFNFAGKTLVAASQKESVLRILDADKLGGDNHMTPLWASPRLGNDAETGTDPGRGVWGAITTYENPQGRRFLYLPMLGEPSTQSPVFPMTNGPRPNGSVLAFEVKNDNGTISAVPVWTSDDMVMPDPPVVANGVVYALASAGQAMQNFAKPGDQRMPTTVSNKLRSTPVTNMQLFAYDAETGKRLWTSGKTLDSWVHFSEPVVAMGKVYVVTHDARVIAFGLRK